MYRRKDKKTGDLFTELFPFGGCLSEDNHWLKLSKLIPWDKLEDLYARYFSETGRPAKDSRLVSGLLIIKHRKSHSDRELIENFLENPYLQYFCGYEHFVRKGEIHYSTLSKLRKRLGVKYFKEFEKELLGILVKERIIKPKEVMIDATICPADITYPTDLKLLNVVREWLCEKINWLRKAGDIKKKVRTYRRVAKRLYLSLQKKKRKSKKVVEKAKKQMLRYVRRNLAQICLLLKDTKVNLKKEVEEKLNNRLETAKKIYAQQKEMVEKHLNRVKDRIVSFHWPEVRPMVRGKDGRNVEFGPKAVISLVNGFSFLDEISYDAFNESKILKKDLKLYRERFGNLPEKVIADRLYGSRWNRKLLKKLDVSESFKPLGRSNLNKKKRAEIRKAERKRSRMEGAIGLGKNKYRLGMVRYRIKDGAELWVRLGLLGMNLTAAVKRI